MAVRGRSLVEAGRGSSPAAARGPLTVVASLVAALRLERVDSVVVAHRFSCPMACETFPDQGSNLCPLYWQAGS